MRHLATIREINNIRPIPNADKIEVATIDGWEVVIAKADNFHVGDLVVYIEVDSVLPPLPQFDFMAKRKYRVKTIKLRGQISQGLIMPISSIPATTKITIVKGADVTDIIGIKKYDPEAEKEKTFYKKLNKNCKLNFFTKFLAKRKWGRKILTNVLHKELTCSFPSWITKTDEERIQNMPVLFQNLKDNNIPLVGTEKVDGTSATYFLKDGEFGVCSRNLWLLSEDDSPYWRMVKQYNLRLALKQLAISSNSTNVVIQGEIIGEGIQNNPYKMKGNTLNLFNIYVNGVRLPHDMLVRYAGIMSLMTTIPIPTVPLVLRSGTIPDQYTIPMLVDVIRGSSEINKKISREGIVFRNYEKGISFKVLNPDYLLKHE